MQQISYSIIDNPQRWALAALIVAFTFIALVDVRPAIQTWGAAPGELGALRVAVETVPTQIVGQLAPIAQSEIRHVTDALTLEVRGARSDLIGELAATRIDILGPDGRFTALQSALLQRADEGLRIIDATRTEGVQPVLAAAAGTLAQFGAAADTYAAIPAQLAASPAWKSLEPEITCRDASGNGYGGCMRGRINGLLGEGVRVGGIFVQHFPSLADSVTGIAADAHGFTKKYVNPHPMKVGDYFKTAGKVTLGIGIAGLHGGVF